MAGVVTPSKRKDPDTSPSPLSIHTDSKKTRTGTTDFDLDLLFGVMDSDSSNKNSMEKLFSKLDLIDARLELCATKQDLKDENAKLVTKEQFENLSKRISELETKNQEHVVRMSKLEADNQKILHEFSNWYKQKPNPSRFVSPPRLNLFIEGLPAQGDPYKLVIEIGKCLDMSLEKRDFSLVIRMKRKTDSSTALVLACFVNMRTHDEFFSKRTKLNLVPKLKKVWVNLDEPEEVRKQRSRMRKLAFEARSKGIDAFYTHNYLRVDGKEFKLNELDKVVIPQGPIATSARGPIVPNVAPPSSVPKTLHVEPKPTEPGESQQTPPAAKPQRPPRLKHTLNSPLRNPSEQRAFGNAVPLPKVIKITKTKAGYTFAGTNAYMSNYYKVKFIFEGVRYQLVEQGYQFKFAMFHKEFDIAQKVLGKTDGYDINDLVKHILALEEWNHICKPLLKGLVVAKFSQNPELMDELIATYPHPLIEATRDPKWGGGASLLEPWVLLREIMNLVRF